MQDLRIDKWLWAARFFKTRSLAQDAIERGRVLIDDERVKVARAVRLGERITVRAGDSEQIVIVRGLSDQRRGAPEARLLYEETAESAAARERQRERRRFLAEPAYAIHGRPTKRDRRLLGSIDPGGDAVPADGDGIVDGDDRDERDSRGGLRDDSDRSDA